MNTVEEFTKREAMINFLMYCHGKRQHESLHETMFMRLNDLSDEQLESLCDKEFEYQDAIN